MRATHEWNPSLTLNGSRNGGTVESIAYLVVPLRCIDAPPSRVYQRPADKARGSFVPLASWPAPRRSPVIERPRVVRGRNRNESLRSRSRCPLHCSRGIRRATAVLL